MSYAEFGPTNGGGSRPHAISPTYAEAYVCDVHNDNLDGPEFVRHVEGASNLKELKRRGHQFHAKVQDVCDACYARIADTPTCRVCKWDMEEQKRGAWLCVSGDPRCEEQEIQRGDQ